MYTVVDIETTGLSRRRHQITEIAALKVRDEKVVDSFETLINPQAHIPSFITKLTGIDDEMVRYAPTIREVLPWFVKFVGRDVFVAHNAVFDYGFVDENIKRETDDCCKRWEVPKLCTRKLASRMFPELPRKRLSDVCAFLDVPHNGAHRAMGDVRATAAVLGKMLDILRSRGVSGVEEVLRFERLAGREAVRQKWRMRVR